MIGTKRAHPRRFQLILIKPSHYDADGYVVQWFRSTMPSNSLAAVYALACGAADRGILGADLPIDVTPMDETNTRVKPKDIARRIADNGGLGLVGIVGAQSNEFPRAVDIARPLRAAGVQVMIGGFHVSGCLAMLKETPSDIKEAQDLGVSIYAGEAEEGLDEVILDAARGELKPLYDHMKHLPDIGEIASPPFLPVDFVQRTIGNVTSFDAGRGCPFQCSFCTIINVQGRKSRYRSPDSVEQILRMNYQQGINRFFITDDNFARNKDWEAIFDRIIKLREEDGLDIRFCIQVDTLCHKIENFIDKSKRAGVTRVFIGLENINPANLIAAKKRQNKITEYRKMLLEWKRVGIITYAGYILGFENDTPESIRHDLEIIKKELPVDMLEFFILTPLPGSEDHKVLHEKGVWMDPDMNKYDVEHVVTAHPKMTEAEWKQAYQTAWGIYYTDEHFETIIRRAHVCGINLRSLMPVLFWFSSAVPIEGVHPLQWGIFRIKYRHDRRAGLPLESPFVFYSQYAADIARKVLLAAKRWRHLKRIVRKVEADPRTKLYKDEALTPVIDEDSEHMELYTQNEAARVAVEREWRVAAKAPNGNGAKARALAAQRANGHNGNGNGHDVEHLDVDVPRADEPSEPISPLV
ncbi:MAG: radical SAM protein [Methyloceanibacter sp.]